MKSYKPISLCILSAALLTLSFPGYNLSFLAWIALVPFFIAIRHRSFREAALLSFLTGIVFYYCLICWINYVAVLATALLVFYVSLYFVLFGLYARVYLIELCETNRNDSSFISDAASVSAIPITNAKLNNTPLPIFIRCALLAAFWMILEFLRTNLFTGFGWGLLGYSQASNLPIIQMADVSGAYGVSFLAVFVNVAVYEFFFRPPCHCEEPLTSKMSRARNDKMSRLLYNKLVNFLLVLTVVFICIFYGFCKLNTSLVPRPTSHVPLRISVIQGNIPQNLKWDEDYAEDILQTYAALTKEALPDNPDLVIWPETAYPYPEIHADDFAVKDGAFYLVGANRIAEDGRLFNSALLLNNKGEVIEHYDKINLVPFGEYVPFNLPSFIYKVLPEKINMVGNFSQGRDFTVFYVPRPTSHVPLRFSVLICFEDIFPELSRQFVKNGAEFLINITNDAWFGRTAAPLQHAQASVFRAVENRRPVIRCGNAGFSAFISPAGRAYGSIKDEKSGEIFISGHKTAEITAQEGFTLTFYARHGNIFIYLSALLVMVATYFPPKTHKLLRKLKA